MSARLLRLSIVSFTALNQIVASPPTVFLDPRCVSTADQWPNVGTYQCPDWNFDALALQLLCEYSSEINHLESARWEKQQWVSNLKFEHTQDTAFRNCQPPYTHLMHFKSVMPHYARSQPQPDFAPELNSWMFGKADPDRPGAIKPCGFFTRNAKYEIKACPLQKGTLLPVKPPKGPPDLTCKSPNTGWPGQGYFQCPFNFYFEASKLVDDCKSKSGLKWLPLSQTSLTSFKPGEFPIDPHLNCTGPPTHLMHFANQDATYNTGSRQQGQLAASLWVWGQLQMETKTVSPCAVFAQSGQYGPNEKKAICMWQHISPNSAMFD